jgi:DNA-binding transcriptional MerR regulator
MPVPMVTQSSAARPIMLSTQAVRNYEAAGILPAAERTPHGYRTYTPLHAQALRGNPLEAWTLTVS